MSDVPEIMAWLGSRLPPASAWEATRPVAINAGVLRVAPFSPDTGEAFPRVANHAGTLTVVSAGERVRRIAQKRDARVIVRVLAC